MRRIVRSSIGALASRNVSYSCSARCARVLHAVAHARLAHSRAAKPFRNYDAWPSAVAAAFYLRTRSSSFPTKSAKAANERRRPARMHHTTAGGHLSRGCIHRACLTRVYPRASWTQGQCGARPRDECSRMYTTPPYVLELLQNMSHARYSRSRSCYTDCAHRRFSRRWRIIELNYNNVIMRAKSRARKPGKYRIIINIVTLHK